MYYETIKNLLTKTNDINEIVEELYECEIADGCSLHFNRFERQLIATISFLRPTKSCRCFYYNILDNKQMQDFKRCVLRIAKLNIKMYKKNVLELINGDDIYDIKDYLDGFVLSEDSGFFNKNEITLSFRDSRVRPLMAVLKVNKKYTETLVEKEYCFPCNDDKAWKNFQRCATRIVKYAK